MDGDDSTSNPPRVPAAAPLGRRTFGQAVGMVAVASMLQARSADTAPARSSDRGRPGSGRPDDLCDLRAIELLALMRRKEVSAREVMAAHLSRIEKFNPRVNAIVTLVAERALADAARADELAARGGPLGALHGLPVAHKDLVDTAGIRTTRGSPFYRDNVPTRDALIVTRILAAGAITCGKTNTPELGAGSQTFNSVFGATRNPYDLTKTCGGSSGGAAVALACGMLPIAAGSDTGGSLRNPAAFCNVVGIRPSPGRVPSESTSWSPLSVSGPMARSVADTALFLSAMAGPDQRSPLSIAEDGARFRAPLERDFKGVRVAWWRGVGGIPFEPEIRRVVDANRGVFEGLGCIVEEAEPDFAGVDEAFPALRYAANHPRFAPLVRERPEWVKDTIKFEVAQAERLTGADIGRALARQARMYEQSRQFFERYEYFVLPVTQVSPFDVNAPYPKQIAETPMTTYIDWMRSCWYVTFMANPAISVPAGFTVAGLPVGIQIVGRHRDEWSVLQIAHAFEQVTQHGKHGPRWATRDHEEPGARRARRGSDMIASGARLGPYEITAAIGAGGMGEVFRAHDAKLNRDVAIKVLPAALASDRERLGRFKREAQVLASLNHPNIAHVYGFETATLPDGSTVHFLAMELVEGDDLAERLRRGAIPVDETIAIAKQIAEGLEEAHEHGIIHRDLKPANVKVTPDGKVKVLDFGLAKALEGEGGVVAANGQLSHSPTMSRHGTEAGMILGTAAYMSPEQARGKTVDRRADIWSFGVVLYEMFTGNRLFAGETVSDVLAAVLTREPDWSTLPTSVPGPIRRLLRRCLERDPKNRIHDIADARIDLASLSESDEGPRSAAPARFASRPAAALLASLGLAALALGLLRLRETGPTGLRDVVQTSITLPHGHALVAGPEISRDGRRIAFVSTDGLSRPQLYTRRLDEAELRLLAGAEGADMPFFSPDGRWIAFYARGGLFKIRVDGGEPVRLADAPTCMGGHWLEDDTIIFTRAWNGGLYRINANGGAATPLLIPDRKSYYAYTWPFVLPGGQAILFNRWGTTSDLMRLNLADMSQSVVAPGQWRRSAYTASGHIVFSGDGGDLLGLPAGSPTSRAVAPEPLLGDVAGGDDPNGYTRASVSASGALMYAPLDASQRSLVLVDRAGTMAPLPGSKNSYEEIVLSPDARRVAFTSSFKVFVQDLARGGQVPLAPELPRSVDHPLWTPDGARIVFSANHAGTWDLYSKAASGAGDVKLVFRGPFDQYGTSMMRDGTIVYEESHDKTAKDIWLLPPGGEPKPWLVTPANESLGRASPDGRIMAFSSNVSGRNEVYAQPLDRSSDAVPVSTDGGTGAVWSPAGDRLFFRQGRRLMAASVKLGPRLTVAKPEVALDGGWELGQDISISYYKVNFDLMPDGRFLMVRNDPEAMPLRINMIFNWFEELKARVPVR